MKHPDRIEKARERLCERLLTPGLSKEQHAGNDAMLIHSEAAELQTRVDLVLSSGDCLEDALHCDFWQHFKGGELDYQVTVDVTDSEPDLGTNPWFCIGGERPNEVYLSRIDVRELAGRKLWTFEACISANLPKPERCPPHYCDNQGTCHYCGIVMEPEWYAAYTGEVQS